MNQTLFIIIILSLISVLLWSHTRIFSVENMNDCSLNDKTILQNPIFKNIKEINNKKLIKYLEDFDNNILDDKHILGDFLQFEDIKKLELLLNSYQAFNPVSDIILTDKTNLKIIKNIILKNIILNHLHCYGDNDPELFWIKLHLLNKTPLEFNLNLKTTPLIEMFNNEKNLYNYENTTIISYNKHLKNIAKELISNHPILKDILNDFTPVFEFDLHSIIINLLDYLTKLEKPSQEINKKIRNLYVDLRELILINQIMYLNPNLQVGLSSNKKTFVLDHNFYQNHLGEIKENLYSFDTFEKLIESTYISKANQSIRKIFLNKVMVYLKYNGIKVENNEYEMLSINSVNLKNMPYPFKLDNKVNSEFIEYLKVKITGGNIDKFTFRIKNI
ncbi:hypothetical protein crov222 [Cafeteria roenbergensis virus]|uniref:Uncharacterized protein n=1 Tax=Cafeteria roenbergensis virus (strain BV-PW1) TaxID=693272 RepID=E3T4Z2_CROVB|nr:hypothetical protein crov222 [Cafeteria roenbergensis virus BV-PW1]ADO67255.1 hypothetical protein crov222 [Cafeteria roenbergensis virus BV-PW1]